MPIILLEAFKLFPIGLHNNSNDINTSNYFTNVETNIKRLVSFVCLFLPKITHRLRGAKLSF